MPAVTTRAPGLTKPKSKLRLRLGLGGKDSPAKPEVPSLPHDEPHSATSSHFLQPGSSFGTTSTTDAPTESIGESTNTTSSTQSAISRGDSRSAFALDISTSSDSSHGPNHNFDTISYATASPQSAAFGSRVPSTYSSSTVLYQQDAYHQSTHSLATSYLQEELSEIKEELNQSHPAIAHAVEGADDVFSMTDEQLGDKFAFSKEIGFGNWGSVWQARPRRTRAEWEYDFAQTLNLGKKSASVSGGLVAMKLVHRIRDETTAARVKALWSEMKIIRSLRHEPHPSIINFEAFIITPSYALVCMPFLYELIPVSLPPARAIPYFRQLASAVGYLHERGITHNDIKPANVLLSYTDIPVLVDFGFANQYDVRSKSSFLSNVCWGTPEYLDPQRAYSLPHDERASDVWSLGVTMFEILIGRTPFEEDEQEEFSSPEELQVYYQRSSRGVWIGEWRMPRALQQLLQAMICPDPQYRISAMQAYHHPSLALAASTAIQTPQFVRAAQGLDEESFIPVDLPLPTPRCGPEESAKKKKPTKKKEKKPAKEQARSVTPALGESIKQHTSMSKPKRGGKEHKGEHDKENGDGHIRIEITPSPKKKSLVVIKSTEGLLAQAIKRNMEDDATPTRSGKPAQPLRIQELAAGDKPPLRASAGQAKTLARTTSHNSLATTARATVSQRSSVVSAVSDRSTSTVQPKNQEEAVLRTMRSLEGTRRIERTQSRDVLGNIKRPAPSPPRPRSVEVENEKAARTSKEDPRRSLGIERTLAALKEESPARLPVPSPARPVITPNSSPRRTPRKGQPAMVSPPRPRTNTRPTEVVRDGRPFPASVPSSPLTPMTDLRQKILTMDKDNVERFRKLSAELMESQPVMTSSGDVEPPKKPEMPVGAGEGKTMDEQERRDKFASWLKGVEQMVAEARQAVEEGREAAMPDIADLADLNGISLSGLPTSAYPRAGTMAGESMGSGQTILADDDQPEKQFGVTPKRASAVPVHLRTSSVQVEPATPPKWMVEEEAARQLAAKSNALPVEVENKTGGVTEDDKRLSRDSVTKSVVMRKGAKKERPTVTHVLKLFGAEKDKMAARSQTPEPMSTVPLKSAGAGHSLRAAPSTPALRTATLRPAKALGRKSESNLRNFSTMPSLTALLADAENNAGSTGAMRPSPRRAVYEGLLSSEPGVVRQGDGWSSWSSGRGMAKTTSIGSLRERALAFLRDDHRDSKDLRDVQRDVMRDSREIGSIMSGRERHIVDLAAEVESGREGMRRTSRSDLRAMGRPATPGANSVLLGGRVAHDKRGIFGKLKGIMGRKGMEKLEEV